MTEYIRIHRSDLEKIRNALERAESYFRSLNQMNSALHQADPVYSPLTGTVSNAKKRCDDLLDGLNIEED